MKGDLSVVSLANLYTALEMASNCVINNKECQESTTIELIMKRINGAYVCSDNLTHFNTKLALGLGFACSLGFMVHSYKGLVWG